MTSISSRRPRTLGTSIVQMSTISVACSSAASACSPSPGAVSTTTYWNSRASCCSTRPTSSPLMRSASAGIGRRAQRVDRAVVHGEERLQHHRVEARGAADGVGERVLGLEPERARDVAELGVEVDEHGGHRGDAAEGDGDVRRERRLADAALRRGDDDDPALLRRRGRRRVLPAPCGGGQCAARAARGWTRGRRRGRAGRARRRASPRGRARGPPRRRARRRSRGAARRTPRRAAAPPRWGCPGRGARAPSAPSPASAGRRDRPAPTRCGPRAGGRRGRR